MLLKLSFFTNHCFYVLDELLQAKEKYKSLSDELESTLTDISGM